MNTSYISITQQDELEAYCQQILANSAIQWIAIDTEFVRVDTFFPELSLVQIQDCLGEAAIIDPIAIVKNATSEQPLHALVELLSSENLIKVFHSARQDIEVLYQLENIMPANIFDTQIAAIFKKHGDLAGFARVIKAELGVDLDKSQTRTNWHARPLTEEQIEYALDDVRYLAPLYKKFTQELNQQQLQAVQEDSFAMLDESLYKADPATAGTRIKNLKGLRAKGIAIVNTLAEWRELYAIENNQPKKWVMSDDVIVAIAKRPPKTVQALYKVPNIKASSVREFGEIWISLIDEVFNTEVEQLPTPEKKPSKPNAQEEMLLQFLHGYMQHKALQYNLTPTHILNKNQLLAFIRSPASDFFQGWRKVLIGEELFALIQGKACLQIDNGQLNLISS